MLHEKVTDRFGNTVEMKIWQVPRSESMPHGYKYSLVYVADGERVIGYDNSKGKGDHRHIEGRESGYAFRGLRHLIHDFQKDVDSYRERYHEG